MKKTISFLMVFILLIPMTGFANDSKKAAFMEIVRALGYGAAIHQFKNCLLRSKFFYCSMAYNHFADAQKAIKTFHKLEPSEDEKIALDKIAKIIRKYKISIFTLQVMIVNKVPADQIDLTIKIRDRLAIDGLTTLWNKQDWSAIEEVEYFLGYGNAIHHFKNYVIRAKDKDSEKAEQWFTKAEIAAAKISKNPEDIAGILQVLKAYRAILPTIQAMSAEGKTPREIDKAVKINDTPAFSAIARLRNKY